MIRIQQRLSVVFMVAVLCHVAWVYGGAKKQGRASGVVKSSVTPVSVPQGLGQAVVNEQIELAALDKSTCSPWTGDSRQHAQALFARLKEHRIAIQPSFYKLLGKAAPAERGQLINRCQLFFDSVDIQEVPSTGCLTSMIRTKKQVGSFLSYGDDLVRRVARTPALRSLTSLFHHRGFPQAEEDTQAFIEWEIWWQGEGQAHTLDRELLRTFSSMLSGKGIPDKQAVEDYLKWEIWWQGAGRVRSLDRELLRTFSSMFNGRGLPDKKAVDDYLQLDVWWQGEGKTRTLDRGLLRTFSSMFNGRGLPNKKAVDDYLQLDVWWQGEGEMRALDRELLRTFSAMFNGRGLPDKKVVQEYLQWELWWQGEGETRALDRELLRTFSSMFHGRGLPDKTVVEEYLQWGIWWQGEGKTRALDRELLSAFSSMFSCRGLPEKKAVQNYLNRDIWWQGQDEIRTLDRELLRTFSSMFSGKGLPDTKAIDNYLQWQIWWPGDGEGRTLDRELLRIFSSMFNGKGLPDKKAVEDYLQLDVWWQGSGETRTLDRELLHIFSSMFNGKGLPDKKTVVDYLQWKIWWQDEGNGRTLDRRLLRTFSSMLSGRGLPDKKIVEEYLRWELWWQGEGEIGALNRELLRAFSSMFHGKGVPNKLGTDAILQWLMWDTSYDRQTLKLMVKLYSGAYAGHKALGLPDINKLRRAEQKLIALIPSEEFDQDEDHEILPLIKVVALYLVNYGGTQQLSWSACQAWLREHPCPVPKTDLLRQLLRTLHYHGGRGIKEAVSLISGKPMATKWFVLDAMGNGQALASVQYALEAIESGERQQYLSFTRELQPMPSAQQWQTIRGYLKTLAPALPDPEYRRWFLTLIWPFSANDRERFVQPESVASLITLLLPSIQVMRKLSKSLTTAELRTLFDTCLAYQAGQPDKEGLPILFRALLLAQLPLLDRGTIPPGILAQTDDQPEGVVVAVNPAIGIKDSVTLFIRVMAVLMEELWDCEYTVNGPTLTLWPHGSIVPITLPTPALVWHPDGVQIRHWSSAHLHRFYQATECWQGHYREAAEPSDNVPDTVASRTERRNGSRAADVAQPSKGSVVYLSLAMLRGILKNRVPMNPVAWASADYHKDKLPLSLLALLKERAEADSEGLVPDSLKVFLSGYDQRSQITGTYVHPASPSPAATWLETVLRQSVLSGADIDQLYTFRGQLTSDQVADILLRMDQSMSQETMQRWQLLLEEKHQQDLKTNLPWLYDSDQAMESVHDVEDILGDLFPSVLL